MREIKFRAWDTQINKFIEEGFSVAMDGTDIYDDNGVEINDYILMQFTGLKDKNGVEIYEGDIVIDRFSEKEVKGEIKISPVQGVLVGNTPIWRKNCEVIGNIYQNPELLK